MVALRTGAPLRAQLTVEEAEAVTLPDDHARLFDGMRRRWVIGTPDEAAAQIAQLAATYGVDEVMVHPVGGAYADESARTARSRENALSLLAAGLHAGVHAHA
jgi:alkanesulfonate monooxygenase SsuD/methylene tetrahydromethanopterin reductase-like flavin-dependent oxidoreductase (luciferase family)